MPGLLRRWATRWSTAISGWSAARPAPAKERGIDSLPSSLIEAIDCLEQDPVVKAALGDTYADYYIEVKREEWRQYHSDVSQWESDRYLPIY